MIYFFVLLILLILAALVIALIATNSITLVISSKKIHGGNDEYDYSPSSPIFGEIRQLVNNMLNGIDSETELFDKCIRYKGIHLLLKNILILKKKPPYGVYLKLGDLEMTPLDLGPFKSYYEPFLISCTFDQIMDEYDRFKETKQSYLIYWINLLNIFRILIRFKYDTILNGAYLDSNNECDFMRLVDAFIIALNCEYSNILIAYKKYIEYIICANGKASIAYINRWNELFCRNEYEHCINELLELDEAGIYLLLSANVVSETRYAIFEGTKFLISSSNPYKMADDIFSDVVPVICHDIIPHNAYKRKLALTHEGEIEFRELYNLSIAHNYPNIFKLIFEMFHECDSINSAFPYSKYLFICNCISLILFCEFVNSTSNEYIGDIDKSNKYETLSFIKDTDSLFSNALDLSEFLYKCQYIDEYSYNMLSKYIESKDSIIYRTYRSREFTLMHRHLIRDNNLSIYDAKKSLAYIGKFKHSSALYDDILENIDKEREKKNLSIQRVAFLKDFLPDYN
jgi:hypothetical protein